MNDFTHFGLSASLIASLKNMQIMTPTPVQSATIPLALAGKDVLASAQTGSGKTIAYALPLIMHLLKQGAQTALILTPTRELATQVHQTLIRLMGGSSIKSVLLIGGAPMQKQFIALKKHPQLLIGTPGRVNDHLKRGTLSLAKTNFLVVDEADCMLDMGFEPQLNEIAKHLPSVCQTVMFSATFPANIEKLARKYLKNPERVSIDTTTQEAPKIKEEIIRTSAASKFDQLLDQLIQRQGSIIIFTRTRRGAQRLSKDLKTYGHSSDAIHGDLSQGRRDSAIRQFRNGGTRIMVATDVASRGLDIPHVRHVINYDPPQRREDYIHRIGRTGRAGSEGNALCLVTSEEHQKWRGILNMHAGEGEKSATNSRAHRPKKRRPWMKNGPRR